MRLKVGLALLLVLATFPALTVGVAQQTVHAALQAVSDLVGSPHG
jgi:hypothetical protein